MSPVRCELLFFCSSAGTLLHRNVERCTKILSAGPTRFLVKVAQGSLPEDWMPVKLEISAIVILLSSSLMNEVSQADKFIHAEAKSCCAALILCMFLVAERLYGLPWLYQRLRLHPPSGGVAELLFSAAAAASSIWRPLGYMVYHGPLL